MSEETKAAAGTAVAPAKGGSASGAEVAKKPRKKSLWPTNCAQSNKRIRRKDWYYRDGKYFANKQAHKLYVEQEAEKKAKALVEAKEKAAKAEAASQTPAAEAPNA